MKRVKSRIYYFKFKFQNSAEREDERDEVTRQGSSSGDPLADPSQDAGGNHGIMFYFKNIFNPRWIFYLLSSCSINHMHYKCTVNQCIYRMNRYFREEARNDLTR